MAHAQFKSHLYVLTYYKLYIRLWACNTKSYFSEMGIDKTHGYNSLYPIVPNGISPRKDDKRAFRHCFHSASTQRLPHFR